MRIPYWLGIGMLTAQFASATEPFVERVWPPVLQRGQTKRIEFTGQGLGQTSGLWTSVPGVEIHGRPIASESDGQISLDITLPADAPLGLYGLRLATPNGLSNPHLFLIDELPVTVSQPVAAPVVMITSLPVALAATVRAAHVDRYGVEVTSGQKLTFEVIGNRLGKNFDPVVTIRDSQGKFIARGDNSVGLMFDCRFAHTFPTAGRYVVEVTDARYAGEPDWTYVLRIGEFPAVWTVVPAAANPQARGAGGLINQELRIASTKPATWVPIALTDRPIFVEQEPNDAPEQATTAASPLALSGMLCGVLREPGEEDWFQFPLAKGQTLRVRSLTQAIGSAADLELILYEPTNEPIDREVARNDETSVSDGRNTNFVQDANLTFGARTDGLHRLLVRDLTEAGSAAHTYVIEISENLPELRLAAEISALTVPRGTWQPLPLKITRTSFQGPIELELRGAPVGVSLEPNVIPAEATEFVGRLTASVDVLETIATLQIIGRATVTENGQERTVECLTTTHPLIDRQLMNKDRILYALRVDQRDLPHSLTDRIALQITPAAPFDFQLTDEKLDLPKYQTADLKLTTSRTAGFDGPITFSALGGQLGDEREERVQVYFRAPPATVGQAEIIGTFANRILTNYQQSRVDVTAVAEQNGRTVRLTRTLRLDIHPAFQPQFEPAQIEITPGAVALATVQARRVPTFEGEIQLTGQNLPSGIAVKDSIMLSAGQTEQMVEIAVKPELPPGRYELRYEAAGYVGKFQELVRSPVLVVNVKKPENK